MGGQVSGINSPVLKDEFCLCIDDYIDSEIKFENKKEEQLKKFGAIYFLMPEFKLTTSDYRDDNTLKAFTKEFNNYGLDYELFRRLNKKQSLEYLLFFPENKMIESDTQTEKETKIQTNIPRMRQLAKEIHRKHMKSTTAIVYCEGYDMNISFLKNVLKNIKPKEQINELIYCFKIKDKCP